MRLPLLVVLLLLANVTPGLAQNTARMDQVVQSFVTDGTFTGTVLVAKGNDIIFSKGYGLANREWNIPNDRAVRYRVASLTKQFTAAAILLLEERGKLKIEDPVGKYVAGLPPAWQQMTIFHLLTHTAGFAGLQTPFAARGAPVDSGDGTLAGFVKGLMAKPLQTPPGEVFSYTNSGYFVLGHVIQTISGQGYEQFIRDNIFTPVGMKDTALDTVGVLDRRASSYTAGPNGLVNAYTADRVLPNVASPNSAAGFYSTVEDLLRWQVALYGGKVLSAASVQRMTTLYNQGEYGLGVYVRAIDGRKMFTHGGGAPPFANLTYFPDSRISVVVLGNINIAPAAEIAGFLGALAHGAPVQLLSERKAITLSAEVLARYAGAYEMGGQTFVVTVDGTQLGVQPKGGIKMTLLAESENTFFLSDANIRVQFVRNAAGAVTEFVMIQGTRQERARRVDGPK